MGFMSHTENQNRLYRMVVEDCFVLFFRNSNTFVQLASRSALLKQSSKKLLPLTAIEYMKTEVILASLT